MAGLSGLHRMRQSGIFSLARLFRRGAVWWCLVLAAAFPALAQPAADPGIVVIRATGADAVFGFTSPTPALNLHLASTSGLAESLPIILPAGDYRIEIDDLSGLGMSLRAIDCADGRGDSDGMGVAFTLEAGEMLVCTFTVASAPARAAELIESLVPARGDLMLASLPPSEDRINRLKGSIAVADSPQRFMNALPGIVAGRPIPVAASLGAFDRILGNEQRNPWDVWLRGTFALASEQGAAGRYGVAALGIDRLVNEDFLLGGFLQADTMVREWSDASALLRGGWIAGGYATARVLDNIYFDVLGGGGTSLGVTQAQGMAGRFAADSWLMTAAVLGQWRAGDWTFSPQARLSYFDEKIAPYLDGGGNLVAGQELGRGRLAIGPGVSYRLTTQNNVVVNTGLRLDTTATVMSSPAGFEGLSGRLEGTVEIILPAGARWKTTLGYGGIGTDSRLFNASGTLSVPLR